MFSAVTTMAQDTYTVAIVKGTVMKAGGSKIVPGTKLKLEDKISFSTAKGVLILLHPKKGRMALSPADGIPAGISHLYGTVLSFLSLKDEVVKLSSKQEDPRLGAGKRAAAERAEAEAKMKYKEQDSLQNKEKEALLKQQQQRDSGNKMRGIEERK